MTEVLTSQEVVRRHVEEVEKALLQEVQAAHGSLTDETTRRVVKQVSRRTGAPRSLVASTLRDLTRMQAIELKRA